MTCRILTYSDKYRADFPHPGLGEGEGDTA